MEQVSCIRCGGSNFVDESCELFCLDCGYLDKVAANVTQSQSSGKVAWSLSVKEAPKNVLKINDSSIEYDRLDILNGITKEYAKFLSKELNCSELYQRICRLWITYVNIKLEKFEKNFALHEKISYHDKKSPHLEPTKYLVLRLCFISVKSLGLNFTYFDLKKLIIEKKVNYYTWKFSLDEGEVSYNSEKSIGQSFLPKGDQFYVMSSHLGDDILCQVPKKLDLDVFISRYAKELNFCDIILTIATALKTVWFTKSLEMAGGKFPCINIYTFCEIYAMALLVFAARMYFYVSWVKPPDNIKSTSSKYIETVRTNYYEWVRKSCTAEKINYDTFVSSSHTKLPYTPINPLADDFIVRECGDLLKSTCQDHLRNDIEFERRREWLMRIETLIRNISNNFPKQITSNQYKIEHGEYTDKEISSNDVMNFSNITKPLRKILYNIPCISIDTTPQLDLILVRASQKLSVSKLFFLQVLSDVQCDLMGKEKYIFK